VKRARRRLRREGTFQRSRTGFLAVPCRAPWSVRSHRSCCRECWPESRRATVHRPCGLWLAAPLVLAGAVAIASVLPAREDPIRLCAVQGPADAWFAKPVDMDGFLALMRKIAEKWLL
jgi:hypothetical protein